MAGGSQIIINKNGITFITPSKFESKAGQHLFKSGEKLKVVLPNFNPIEPICEDCLRAAAVSGSSYMLR